MANVHSPLNVSVGLQAVSADCDISSYELQPTFSECLDFFEGDPFEDTRQSKKQKVCRHLSAIHASTFNLLPSYQAVTYFLAARPLGHGVHCHSCQARLLVYQSDPTALQLQSICKARTSCVRLP